MSWVETLRRQPDLFAVDAAAGLGYFLTGHHDGQTTYLSP